jgi:hypothetical protein
MSEKEQSGSIKTDDPKAVGMRRVDLDNPQPYNPLGAQAVPEHTGFSVNYYKVEIKCPTTKGIEPYMAECNDIIEALGMTYAEGNVFKAIWRRCAQRTLGKKKQGNDSLYDAEKGVFFAERVLEQEKNGRQ